MKKLSLCCLMLGIMMLLPTSASAQYLPGISEITAYGGMTFNGSDEATAGASLTANISPRLGIEGEMGFIFADDTVFNVNTDLVFNLGSGATLFVPYLIGGAGILSNGDTEIALNAGAGVKLFVEPNIALRIDFRGFFTTEDGDLHDMERIYAGFDVLF